ncbi:hypothetical protein [Streptomyces solincola]|uniref:hypothetical protein n=1 Tax=Streptomyces solincola TaxID=2100817 RepID=UPI0015E3EC44|nr:hypothetical protein [Streptomyces solincola]
MARPVGDGLPRPPVPHRSEVVAGEGAAPTGPSGDRTVGLAGPGLPAAGGPPAIAAVPR